MYDEASLAPSRASNYASWENPTRLAAKSKVEYTFSRKLVITTSQCLLKVQ